MLEPSTLGRIPPDTAWSIERQYFPTLVENRETFVAHIDHGYWLDIGTPAKYLQAHRDIMTGRCVAYPFAGHPAHEPLVAPTAEVSAGATIVAPCFIAAKARVAPARRSDRTPWSGPGPPSKPARWSRTPSSGRTHHPARRLGSARRYWDAACRCRTTRPSGPTRWSGTAPWSPPTVAFGHLTSSDRRNMTTIDPSIFKAYDVRGTYPDQINEDVARGIGQAFVSYLDAGRIAVSRDMRLSSPALASAFIEGALAQGADVVDYGMLGTDMLYYAVARDELDGGAQITASHNPKQYNGVKLVRAQAFPLSGDAGIGEIRDMVVSGSMPRAGRRGRLSKGALLDDYLDHILSFGIRR